MTLIAKLCQRIADHMNWHVIMDRDADDQVYVVRYHTADKQENARWFLHNIKRPDYEPSPHNHPYKWQLSVILSGGYDEEYLNEQGNTVTVTRRWFNWIPRARFHNIKKLNGDVWTLFIHGPKHGESWGFMVEGWGYVHNEALKGVKYLMESDYWRRKLEPSQLCLNQTLDLYFVN